MSNENKIYLSRNFDNGCWYSFCDWVYIDKYAIADALVTKFNVGIKLVRLPLDVEEILVRYCIICDYEKVQGTRLLSLRDLKKRQIMHSLQLKSKGVYQYLPIKISIEIVKKELYRHFYILMITVGDDQQLYHYTVSETANNFSLLTVQNIF